ncbi:hypothetical protein [Paraburkholderia phenazinium]|uniref:hypothetical protein n=1 Tax=Paraburkholderia phenazinium TaxID=60549 RepID=UPI001FC87B88|nr:hypothetical protein [Paraburkholderia phenazinium]
MTSDMFNSRNTAIAFRDELLANDWPDDARAAVLTGALPDRDPAGHTRDLRVSGALLGVWSRVRHGYLYPQFQFHAGGGLRAEVRDLLEILPRREDRGGWRAAFWLHSPHALLDGQTPAAVFVTDPKRVIAAADLEFNGNRDFCW